ncbi:hypothetical protein Tco_0441233 [Tanacetum coccineum]
MPNISREEAKCQKTTNDNHDLCVLPYTQGVNSRTRQPMAVPVSTREPKHNVNQSVATSVRKPLQQTPLSRNLET